MERLPRNVGGSLSRENDCGDRRLIGRYRQHGDGARRREPNAFCRNHAELSATVGQSDSRQAVGRRGRALNVVAVTLPLIREGRRAGDRHAEVGRGTHRDQRILGWSGNRRSGAHGMLDFEDLPGPRSRHSRADPTGDVIQRAALRFRQVRRERRVCGEDRRILGGQVENADFAGAKIAKK